jgi:hypothetical protein
MPSKGRPLHPTLPPPPPLLLLLLLLLLSPAVLDMVTGAIARWNKPGGVAAANSLITLFSQQALSKEWATYIDAKGESIGVYSIMYPFYNPFALEHVTMLTEFLTYGAVSTCW